MPATTFDNSLSWPWNALVNEISWYGRRDSLCFTTSFWLKLDMFWQERQWCIAREKSFLTRWLKVLNTVLIISGTGLVVWWYEQIAGACNVGIGEISISNETAAWANQLRDEERARMNIPVDVGVFSLRGAVHVRIGLLHYVLHDILFYMITSKLGTNLDFQLTLQVWLSVILSPLHAILTQGSVIKGAIVFEGGVPFEHYIDRAKMLFFPAILASVGQSIAIIITVSCFRWMTKTERSIRGISPFEVVGTLITIAIPWMLLAVPSSIALRLAEISLLPGVETKMPISMYSYYAGPVRWSRLSESAILCAWSWRLITFSKFKVVALQLGVQGFVAYFFTMRAPRTDSSNGNLSSKVVVEDDSQLS